MTKKEPSLLDEFRVEANKSDRRCAVCHKVSKEVREVIEDGIKREVGGTTILKFLQERQLWQWSEQPFKTHKRHMK